MATRPAGQNEGFTLRVRDDIVSAVHHVSMRRKVVSGVPTFKQTLQWIATQSGATTLASGINGISNTDSWTSGNQYTVNLCTDRDGKIRCSSQVQDTDGFDVDDTKYYEFTADGLKEALAQLASDWGSSSLASAILAL